MSKQPPKQPLITFPCQYPIKIIGKAGIDFNRSVVPILHQHIPNLNQQAIVIKHSSHGKYASLTVTFAAVSREQIDNLYRALTADSNILFVL